MKNSFSNVMKTIFEEISFCDDEIKNSQTEEKAKEFQHMKNAYVTIIQYYNQEEQYAKYKMSKQVKE